MHTIDASSPAERDEWVSVLRKHAAHHSIRNVYDVSKRKVAQGDISEVYSAKDFLTNKKKALKILPKGEMDEVSVAGSGDGGGGESFGMRLGLLGQHFFYGLRAMSQDDEL